MGDDIGSGLSSMAVCFDFSSTNVVQLSNRDPYFYRFQCHHPLITQLSSKGIPSQFLTKYLVTLNFLDHCTSQPACSLGKQAQVYSGLCQQQYSRAGQKRMDHFRRHDTFSHFPQSHIPLCKCPIMRITRTEFFVSALILRPRS